MKVETITELTKINQENITVKSPASQERETEKNKRKPGRPFGSKKDPKLLEKNNKNSPLRKT